MKKSATDAALAQRLHEGAIGMVNSWAKLLRDDYCDGLGIVFRLAPQTPLPL